MTKPAPFDDIQAAFLHLSEPHQDALQLLVSTCWHWTEADRFVRSPDSQILKEESRCLATLVLRHRSGWRLCTPIVDVDALASAERLRAKGEMPDRKTINDAIKAACIKAGVPAFTAGAIRHSLVAWFAEMLSHPDEVARFLGHQIRGRPTTLSTEPVRLHPPTLRRRPSGERAMDVGKGEP